MATFAGRVIFEAISQADADLLWKDFIHQFCRGYEDEEGRHICRYRYVADGPLVYDVEAN